MGYIQGRRNLLVRLYRAYTAGPSLQFTAFQLHAVCLGCISADSALYFMKLVSAYVHAIRFTPFLAGATLRELILIIQYTVAFIPA